MQLSSGSSSLSRYIPVVGRAFLCELLYGNKYSPHLGFYRMPYVYIKTILLCAAGEGLETKERNYVTGLIEVLLPSDANSDNLAKLDLIQFVEAVPGSRGREGSGSGAASPVINTQDAVEQLERDHHDEVSTTYLFNSIYYGSEAAMDPSATHSEEGGGDHDSQTPSAESVSSFINSSTFPGSLANILLYDTVSSCVADGLYSSKEKERVALVSAQVGLSTAEREQVERIALQERVLAVRKAKLLLLSPEYVTTPPQPSASKDETPTTTTSSASTTTTAATTNGEGKNLKDLRDFLREARKLNKASKENN